MKLSWNLSITSYALVQFYKPYVDFQFSGQSLFYDGLRFGEFFLNNRLKSYYPNNKVF